MTLLNRKKTVEQLEASTDAATLTDKPMSQWRLAARRFRERYMVVIVPLVSTRRTRLESR